MVVIAIHAGAGYFKNAAEQFCSNALKKHGKGKSNNENIGDQLVATIMELEKCDDLNCGKGSNLTLAGTVECEAAFMCSSHLSYGAIAVVGRYMHPTFAAHSLAKSYKENAIDGLIPPMVLAGPGADSFCASLGLEIIPNDSLKTKGAVDDYNDARRQIEQGHSSIHSDRLDTVGGVAIDMNGESSACVSSGGILLKKEGRVGHSAQFGAAIWAERCDQSNISIAVSLSGCGEALIRTHLAESLAQQILSMDLNDCTFMQQLKEYLNNHFICSRRLLSFPRHRLLVGGLIAIQKNVTNGDGVIPMLIAFHNTVHLPFAFVGSDSKVRRFRSESLVDGEFVCNLFPI